MRVSSLVLALAVLAATIAPGRAVAQQAAPPDFWFAGTRLIFDRPVPLDDDVAVSIGDSGLQRFLARLGATLSYQPQQRYIVITSADRRVITFAIGSTQYSAGTLSGRAMFAPFLDGSDVVVPLFAIARALYVEPVPDAGATVLEPQLGALDVRPDGRRTIVTLTGATPLRYGKVSETPNRVQLTFSGVGAALAPVRKLAGGVSGVEVAVAGSARNPSTTVTITAPRGAQHLIASTVPLDQFSVVFGPPGVALELHPNAAPPAPLASETNPTSALPGDTGAAGANAAPPAAAPQTGPAVVTAVDVTPSDDGGITVRLAIDGSAVYDWHRLADNRWYVDIANATLTGAGRSEKPDSPAVSALRVREIGTAAAPVVRVAFTLTGPKRVALSPGPGVLVIAAENADDTDLARTGNGQIGSANVAQSSEESPAGPPVAPIAPAPEATPWKFGPPPGSTAGGSRLIVIDPGHGGDDAGTVHNGLVEKALTFQISLKLRALLVAQGWSVKLTRTSDIDPISPQRVAEYEADGKPLPDDRAALQTRCDVANFANARMFISIHVNYSPSSAVSGTTFYYTKAEDVPFAQALERTVIPAAGTKDDGVVHGNLYVTKHTTMPAVLIETGFISNPGDVQRLGDPQWQAALAAGIAAGVKAYAGALPALSSQADP